MVTSLTRYNSLNQLVGDLNCYMIGFNSFYDNTLMNSTQSTYPPYNIVEIEKNRYRLEMALSGYSKENLKVYTEDNRLHVEAEKKEETTERYLHRGLSSRSFSWVRVLTDNLVVKNVEFKDGLLTIMLERVVPESHKRQDYL
jgi:molecular chaperone IbpA